MTAMILSLSHVTLISTLPPSTAGLGVSWDWQRWWTYDGISGKEQFINQVEVWVEQVWSG